MKTLLASLTLLASCAVADAQSVTSAPAAALRGLDRLSGELTDLEIGVGSSARFGRLSVHLSDCRYPSANPSGDAFAYVVIHDTMTGSYLFEGWLVASSPALNAFDHMRYDVWALRCITS